MCHEKSFRFGRILMINRTDRGAWQRSADTAGPPKVSRFPVTKYLLGFLGMSNDRRLSQVTLRHPPSPQNHYRRRRRRQITDPIVSPRVHICDRESPRVSGSKAPHCGCLFGPTARSCLRITHRMEIFVPTLAWVTTLTLERYNNSFLRSI
jgi:hypothetical protein